MKDCIFYKDGECITQAIGDEKCSQNKFCPYYVESFIYKINTGNEIIDVRAIDENHLKEKVKNLYGDIDFFLENMP